MATFLFTDIEGSTRLWKQFPHVMAAALAEHDQIISECITRFGGRVIKNTGDGLFAIFEGGQPLECCLAIQFELERHDWGELQELRVRLALNTGPAEQRGDDYFGTTVSQAARLLSAGWGGQILLTASAANTLQDAGQIPQESVLQDQGLHLLKDLEEPLHIFWLRHPKLRLHDFPPLRSLSARPHNLPPQPTPFIGRDQEVFSVLERLDNPDCRLLTLLGPGGMGKTRLAVQVSALRIEQFQHGVYFVPLAAIVSVELILPAIIEALQFTLYNREDPFTQVVNYLREKSLLLVLDNFEHLSQGAALVNDLLVHLPRLKILITSRQRLNLRAEWLYEVPGMAYPGESQDEIEDYTAVQLFMECARRADPEFSITPQERSQVGRICSLVEGLPLGIELSASWVRTLSVQEIAEEIATNLDFLRSNLSDLPERHSSLNAVFDYSWALLSEEERRVFRRLSVFQGGFDRQAARFVANANIVNLSAFVDKSLLRFSAEKRYEMLDTMRQFAWRKLVESPVELERSHSLHAQYFANLMENKASEQTSDRQLTALNEIRVEMENLRQAWEWCLQSHAWAHLDRMIDGLYLFFETRSRAREAVFMFDQASQALQPFLMGTADLDRIYHRLLERLGWFRFRLGQYEPGLRQMQDALGDAEQRGDEMEIAQASYHIGYMHLLLSEHPQAISATQRSLEIYRRLGLAAEQGYCLNGLAASCYYLNQVEQSSRYAQEALEIFTQLDYLQGQGRSLTILSVLAEQAGEIERSRQLRERGLEISRLLNDQRGIAVTLNNLGNLLVLNQDFAGAQRSLEEAIEICRSIGDLRQAAISLNNLASLFNQEIHDSQRSRQAYGESLNLFQQLNDRRGILYTSYDLGQAYISWGEYAKAAELFHQALLTAQSLEQTSLKLYVLAGYASLYAQQGRVEDAWQLVSLIANHADSDELTRQRASETGKELTGKSPEAMLATHELDLEEIVRQTLA